MFIGSVQSQVHTLLAVIIYNTQLEEVIQQSQGRRLKPMFLIIFLADAAELLRSKGGGMRTKTAVTDPTLQISYNQF